MLGLDGQAGHHDEHTRKQPTNGMVMIIFIKRLWKQFVQANEYHDTRNKGK